MKTLKILFVALVLGLAFTSCSKQEDDDVASQNQQVDNSAVIKTTRIITITRLDNLTVKCGGVTISKGESKEIPLETIYLTISNMNKPYSIKVTLDKKYYKESGAIVIEREFEEDSLNKTWASKTSSTKSL